MSGHFRCFRANFMSKRYLRATKSDLKFSKLQDAFQTLKQIQGLT